MKVGLKLFNKDNELVMFWDEMPKDAGQVSMVEFQGTHYAYRSLFSSSGNMGKGAAYARYDECPPPYKLVFNS